MDMSSFLWQLQLKLDWRQTWLSDQVMQLRSNFTGRHTDEVAQQQCCVSVSAAEGCVRGRRMFPKAGLKSK